MSPTSLATHTNFSRPTARMAPAWRKVRVSPRSGRMGEWPTWELGELADLAGNGLDWHEASSSLARPTRVGLVATNRTPVFRSVAVERSSVKGTMSIDSTVPAKDWARDRNAS